MSWFILHTRIQRSSCYIPQTEILFPIKKLKFCHFPGNLFLSKVESYVSSQADNKSQFINQHPLTESFLMEPKEQPGEINDSPIEKVRLTVPITDDTTLQALTFRTWVLGLTACICLAFSNQFFNYRQNHTRISITVFQIFVFPLGKLMAATLPKTPINIPGTKWTFSINPGPFNVKEHVLISTLCASGQEIPFAVEALAATKLFYHRKVHPLSAFLLTHTSQLVGYGCAGMFTKLLVNSPYMWWPSTLADATFYRTLHEAELRPKGQLTRLQFFIVAFVCSVTYHLVPNYFFPSITALSIVCWIWKDSVTAQQIGAGRKGLGIGSFAFDWSTISWLGSPLVVPLITIHNTMLGFILIVYIVAPIVYWTNSYNAKSFPIISSHLFDDHGQIYNITKIVNTERFELLQSGYEKYSKIYLSAFFANSYGFQFASISAGLTHVLVFHGREIWSQFKDAMQNNNGDIHNRMMKKYPSVPQWWYIVILFSMVSLTILTSIFSGSQFQFPWWGILFCVGMSLILILPTGIIQATTNAAPSFYIIMEVTVGYLYPGRPLGNLIFKTYYHVTQSHAKSFLESFKLGFYMKIPPRSMFIVQIVGTFVASSVSFGTAWWVFATVENVCDLTKLPKGSPWTCPGIDTFYDVSLLWGLIGPRYVFAPNGVYSNMYIFFVIGVAATAFVWILTRRFPNVKWIRSIHVPIILGACGSMPPVPSVSYWSWWIVGVFFNNIVYKKFKGWWAKYTYILSTAIEAGVAFLALLLYFTLQRKDIYGLNWWGLKFDDHCPLAHCPTAPGIQVEGCPVFH